MCENTTVSKHFEDEMINIEKDRLEIYNRDASSAMQDRINFERYRNNMEIYSKSQQDMDKNMYSIVKIQTYLMVLQSIIFAGILFSI